MHSMNNVHFMNMCIIMLSHNAIQNTQRERDWCVLEWGHLLDGKTMKCHWNQCTDEVILVHNLGIFLKHECKLFQSPPITRSLEKHRRCKSRWLVWLFKHFKYISTNTHMHTVHMHTCAHTHTHTHTRFGIHAILFLYWIFKTIIDLNIIFIIYSACKYTGCRWWLQWLWITCH